MPEKSLVKALVEASLGSRRRMAAAIKDGRVEVNGEIAENFNHPVDTGTDRVSIDGRPVDLEPKEIICLMLNKPEGVLSTARDERGRRTVVDLLPGQYRRLRLYPVGRLDIDTTGLLLLTNDGDLTYRLTHPRYEHEKEYLVSIRSRLVPEDKRRLEQGIRLEDGMTHPAKVREIDEPPYNYSITIHEGRKRQVRRMFARLGHPVRALRRVRIGRLTLSGLEEGEVRRLSAREVAALMKTEP